MNADRQLILDAVARLPVEQRAVIRRSYYDSWTIARIADDLQIDEQTVTARLHYGVRALLLFLEERRFRPQSSAPPSWQDPEVSVCGYDSLQGHR